MYLNNLLVKTTKGVGTGPKGIGKCAFRGIWRPITSKKHEKQVEHGLEKIKSTEVVGGKEGEAIAISTEKDVGKFAESSE
ncbi:hypothetical protein AX774_g1010 [Zancudomyces culisetae]|uniref:Uncharacterized protein n=1 Tax=Zancudomyces culisetae TaxID=1213189 RepID=A0A1R1PWZ9_ZANCU|nr:hypothetical protein AX774_g1010 [Zancudomyces culisetae]|eukprot:OMH85442.1 hypothetical protein AX774_g1010 [Zancudomyces culisetae]